LSAAKPIKPLRRGIALMGFATRAGCSDVPAFRFAPRGLQAAMHSPVRPRESGDPGAISAFTRVFDGRYALERFQVWVPASAGTNGRSCAARIHIFSCQTALRLPARKQVSFRQKNIGPCSVAGRGDSPDFLSLPSPSNRGGRRADKAQCPDYSGRVCPDYSGREGALRCTPRLAARQRGILAFMPLTVVGPGRLLVAGEAARVRPGDGGCVSLRSQVPLPLPARKTPHENAPRRWIGIGAA
jgi:hypothetical protein